MFVILVYDVGQKRVAKVLKKCRQYLYWVQNSVFEGEHAHKTKATYKELDKILDKSEDSVIVYRFESMKYSSREIIGRDKGMTNIV